MKTTQTTGLTVTDATEGWSCGINADHEGTFTALTMTESKTFKSAKAATAWLAKRGYTADGKRAAKVGS